MAQIVVAVEGDAVAAVPVPREAEAVERNSVSRRQPAFRVDEHLMRIRTAAPEPRTDTRFIEPALVPKDAALLPVDGRRQRGVELIGAMDPSARHIDPRTGIEVDALDGRVVSDRRLDMRRRTHTRRVPTV